jgi:hypothetical protein
MTVSMKNSFRQKVRVTNHLINFAGKKHDLAFASFPTLSYRRARCARVRQHDRQTQDWQAAPFPVHAVAVLKGNC